MAASRGGAAYAPYNTHPSGFDMKQHQIDLFYYFKVSTRRKDILLEYMDFVGVETREEISKESFAWKVTKTSEAFEVRKQNRRKQ